MNFRGIITAAAGFLIIGALHPAVIWAEYYLSARCWPLFLAAGLAFLGASLTVEGDTVSCLLGFAACSFLWSVKEVRDQERRVAKGWFPRNPRRAAREDAPR